VVALARLPASIRARWAEVGVFSCATTGVLFARLVARRNCNVASDPFVTSRLGLLPAPYFLLKSTAESPTSLGGLYSVQKHDTFAACADDF
jgi:hypothetical protein